ncbi:MAG: DUF933 domain-containing protein [Candidatus Omnitrophica bacterium]|nr:DUF933 domain-containing protein [Candidatus Omnitrophota bacterium]MCM8800181.1 DUF933 domain-containing protein [Candidatus Omnitrophota bacterium]
MKVALWGIDYPLGKKNLLDERLERLEKIIHSTKTIPIQIELQDSSYLKTADAFLARTDLKQDLILLDLELIENLISKGDIKQDLAFRIKNSLEKEILLKEASFSQEEFKFLVQFGFLSCRPHIFIDPEESNKILSCLRELYYASTRICFFTTNQKELRAWEIKKGTTAYEASGLIHSDIQRGFIKAEVLSYKDILESGSILQAKAKGLMRLEDRDYLINDADLIYFRFSV